MIELLNKYKFKKVDIDVFYNGIWFIRVYNNEFEIYTDPELDVRYYKGTLDELEYILENI